MMSGVGSCTVFIIFLNDQTLSRWFVVDELKRAQALGKRIIIVHESSAIRGAPLLADGTFDFKKVICDQVNINIFFF